MTLTPEQEKIVDSLEGDIVSEQNFIEYNVLCDTYVKDALQTAYSKNDFFYVIEGLSDLRPSKFFKSHPNIQNASGLSSEEKDLYNVTLNRTYGTVHKAARKQIEDKYHEVFGEKYERPLETEVKEREQNTNFIFQIIFFIIMVVIMSIILF